MFLDEDPGRQAFHRITVEHGNRSLPNNWTAVQLAGDEMHGGAAHLDPVLEGLPLRLQARKRRQQRRMDVENGRGKRVEQDGTNQTHEPGKTHQPHVARAQRVDQRPIVVVAGREVVVRQTERVDSRLARAREAGRVRSVRNHDSYPRVQAPASDCVDNRLQVAAAAGDENAEIAVQE